MRSKEKGAYTNVYIEEVNRRKIVLKTNLQNRNWKDERKVVTSHADECYYMSITIMS